MLWLTEPSQNVEDRRFNDKTKTEYNRRVEEALQSKEGDLLGKLHAIEDEYDVQLNEEYWTRAASLAKSDPTFMKQLSKLMKGK